MMQMVPFIEYPRSLPLSMTSSVTDNLLLLLIFIAVTVVLIGIFRVVNLWDRYRNRIKLDELESRIEKLKRFANQQKRRSLRDAITMLEPNERKHLYRIWEDNAVVSRKALFKLNELEDRLRRTERGAELRWAESRIDEVSDAERKVFPEQFAMRRKKGKK
ncbi:MAG: hypothetical protein U9R75_09810 [Candidatus Thermoplasmatota archaeon]|nr:hypothetical protein [Candidatus Thermoplasmatota archaeon]